MEIFVAVIFIMCVLLFETYRRRKKTHGLLNDVRLLSDHAPRSHENMANHQGGSIKAKFDGHVVTFAVKIPEDGGPIPVAVSYNLPNWPRWLEVYVNSGVVACSVNKGSCAVQPLHLLNFPSFEALRDGFSELFEYRSYTVAARAKGISISFEIDGEDAHFVERIIRRSLGVIVPFYEALPEDEQSFWIQVFDHNENHRIRGSALAYFAQRVLNEEDVHESIAERVALALEQMPPSLLVPAMSDAPTTFLSFLANVQWDTSRWLDVATHIYEHNAPNVLKSCAIQSCAKVLLIEDYDKLPQHRMILSPILKQLWVDRPEDRLSLLTATRPYVHRMDLERTLEWIALAANDIPQHCTLDEFKVIHRPRAERFRNHLATPFYQVIDADPVKMAEEAWCEMALMLMTCFGDGHARTIFTAMSQHMPAKMFGTMREVLKDKSHARSALGALLLEHQEIWQARLNAQQGALSVAGDTGLVGGLSRVQDTGALSVSNGDD